MNRTAKISSGIAAVALLVGGGTAYALSTADAPAPAETPAAVSTETPAPEVIETTPAEEPTPDATTPSPVKVDSPSAEPVPQTREEEFLYYAGETVRGFGYTITDEELLRAGQYTCDQLTAGVSPFNITPIEGAGEGTNGGFVTAAQKYLC